MKIRKTNNKDFCETVIQVIKANGGYCPCTLLKNEDTKCMCKDFRDKVKNGYRGECHCGLYEAVDE